MRYLYVLSTYCSPPFLGNASRRFSCGKGTIDKLRMDILKSWPAVQQTHAWNFLQYRQEIPAKHGIEYMRLPAIFHLIDRHIRCFTERSTNYKYSTDPFPAVTSDSMPHIPVDLERAAHPGPDQVHRMFCFLSWNFQVVFTRINKTRRTLPVTIGDLQTQMTFRKNWISTIVPMHYGLVTEASLKVTTRPQ